METLLALRAIAWKVADQALVFADWDGFREMALPGDRPGGLLRWCARMAASLGLFDATWWIPYFFGGLALGGALHLIVHGRRRPRLLWFWFALGLFTAFEPLALCGDWLWDVLEKAFGLMHLFGLVVACGLYAAGRAACRRWRGAWTLPACCAACAAAIVPFGLYAPIAGAALAVRALAERGAVKDAKRFLVCSASAAIVACALPASCALVYGDMACAHALQYAHGFHVPHGFSGMLRHALDMERRVRDRDWPGVMALADEYRVYGCDFPLRMEIAYRILAQFHLGRLPEDLFRYPIRTSHYSTDANQAAMDGYVLLFEYGLLQPARRYIFERMYSAGPEPTHYRYLGEIAMLLGERLLAYRNFRLLRRCPFRRAFAENRLAALADPSLVSRETYGMVAAAQSVWQEMQQQVEVPFISTGERIERIVYGYFRTMRKAPEFMARMLVSVLMLDGDVPVLVQNTAWLDRLSPPPRPWPTPVQEAICAWAGTLSGDRRADFLSKVRMGAVAPATAAKFEAFKRMAGALAGPASDRVRERLIRDFGDTYFFYDCWVHPGEQHEIDRKNPERVDAEGR